MKFSRILIILTAFLLVISSYFSLQAGGDRTPVYINLAAMVCLVILITILNFQKNERKS